MATINQLNIGGTAYDIKDSTSGYMTTSTANSTFLKLTGGTISGQILSSNAASNYIKGREKSLIRINSVAVNEYKNILSMKTANGNWAIGHYNNSTWASTDALQFSYTTDEDYSSGTNNAVHFGIGSNLQIINGIVGINTGNLIASWTSNTTWTCTKNCIITGSGYAGVITLDGQTIWPSNNNAKNWILPVKKGQVVVMNGLNSTYVARAWATG